MSRRGADPGRQIGVAIVGVSGGEREKGVTGVGKSCLCNRFIKPQEDNYYVDHISVLSQTDFSGRVVNNDHFLYWGESSRLSEEGMEYNFHVIEQTEFIDDASFMPFKAGKMDPYTKRCCSTKIQSAEKLMYICKNQLGIEKEYEQKMLPDGKLNVDGFICIFDVSQVPNRSLEKMVELTAIIMNNCLKTKKPIVLVTTKNDEANEVYIKEAEKLASRKEFKGNVPLVETSSHENVNVDLAFMTLAQLIDRNRGRIRIVPFFEAARHRKELLDFATDSFQRLVRTHVTDYRALWSVTSKKLAQSPDYIQFVDLFGVNKAAKLFRRHVKKLKDEFLQRKVESYMDLLPSILREFFPDLPSLGDGDWLTIQQRISEHEDFDRYFIRCSEDIPWSENLDLLDSADSRIPFDVLDSNEAETVYKNHVNALQAELEMRELPRRMRDRFKSLLSETGYVTPGKRLDEVRVLFMGRESFDSLTEHDRQFIYDQHQKEITEKARQNFLELLLEHAELFYHVKSLAPAGTITQEDIREITHALQEDNRLENERSLILLQHLAFIHCPKKEHCPSYSNCMDCLIEKIMASKSTSGSRPNSGTWSKNVVDNGDHCIDRHVNLVLLGMQDLAENMHCAIQTVCEDDEYELEGIIYSIYYHIIGSVGSLSQNSFWTSDFVPQGIVCAYSDDSTFEFLRESLEKSLLNQLEKEDSSLIPPITILFSPCSSLDQNSIQHLQDEGLNLAERVILCMLCGDPYSIENVLSPLLNHQWCMVTGERSISLQTFLDESKRRVEVIISSYHGANAFREDLVHGFILVYSTKRKASLATLRAFSVNIPNLPIQILAVTDTSSASAFFTSDISQQLITEGNAIADRLQAHFMTSTSTCQQKSAFYIPFFKEVWDKKPEIEQAFNMEDPSGLDDSGEGTLERPPHHLQTFGVHGGRLLHHHRRGLPPRSRSAEGSSSEIYETVPTDGSFGDDINEPLSPAFPDDQALTPSDDSDIYSHIENDEEEHLVKPSQLKKQNKYQHDLYRQSYPSSESLPTTVSSRSKVSNQAFDRDPTYPPFPSYQLSTSSPPPYAFISREQSFDGPFQTSVSDLGSSSPSAPSRDSRPPPYSFNPRTLPHDAKKVESTSRHHFIKTESLALDSDREYLIQDSGNSGGGLQVYPPPTTPPEPAPPDRDCIEGPPARRLVKATTLPADSMHSATSHTSLEDLTCWVDDSMCTRRVDDYWVDSTFNAQSFTTGRRGKLPPPPVRPKPKGSQTLKQPGKLNLKNYSNVTDILSKINLRDGGTIPTKLAKVGSVHAPLATPENMDLGSEYATVKDAVPGLFIGIEPGEYGYSRVPDGTKSRRHRREKGRQAYSDSDSEWSSLERRRSSDSYKNTRKVVPKRMKKKRIPIPVATPRVPVVPSLNPEESGLTSHYSDEKLLLDSVEKVPLQSGSASDDSNVSDPEDFFLSQPKYFQKRLLNFRKKPGKGKERGITAGPPSLVLPLPIQPTQLHLSHSHPPGPSRMGFSSYGPGTPPYSHPSFLFPFGAQVTPDSDFFSPLCRPDGEQYYRILPEDDSSIEVSSPRDLQSPSLLTGPPVLRKDLELASKKEKAQFREEEKKRLKEEEKLRKEREKEKKKSAKSSNKAQLKAPPQPTLEEFLLNSNCAVPLFVEKCISFIEAEGLDSEGIYRVPGNKAHVELLTAKFKEDNHISFNELDIPVNAAATALKDYLKQIPPLLPQNKMEELTSVAGIGDRSCRLLHLKEILMGLPSVNFEALKFIFQHFVRIAENCKLNSMDSKNLAICWWPTLLHTLQFSDISEFESQRPHIEDIVQTMIDQFPFLFLGKEDYVMV